MTPTPDLDSTCFIDGVWATGLAETITTVNPATGETDWSAGAASSEQVAQAVASAKQSQPAWERSDVAERIAIIERFAQLVERDRDHLAGLIAAETGKPLWEAATEVNTVAGKARLAIDAYHERTPHSVTVGPGELTHRALGVVAVLGPYNFPAHLPNGQILPALIAGNAVVYKPSELTPRVAVAHVGLLAEAGVPDGVLNLIIGAAEVGQALVAGPVDAVAFTGSVRTGRALHAALANRPEVVLALEMGGNNPLVVDDWDDLDAAANVIARSAFISAGQRCTCTRRLFVPSGDEGDRLIDQLVSLTGRLRIGAPGEDPEPFAGPVISERAANAVRERADELVAMGASLLAGPGERLPGTGFVRPTIVDVSGLDVSDDEIFGPLLQVIRYDDFDSAVSMAADTDYGLAAGFISTSRQRFDLFRHRIKAGVVNWNTPTTGASGRLPFGGVGASGNHRPAGWSAADFCAYPVATMAADSVTDSAVELRGLVDLSKDGDIERKPSE